MPILKKAQSAFSHIVPQEYKQEAISFFTMISSEISADDFIALAEADISIWQSCINDDLKTLLREGVAIDFVKPLASFIPDTVILEWVLEARPDLATLFATPAGRFWFFRQIVEVKKEIGL